MRSLIATATLTFALASAVQASAPGDDLRDALVARVIAMQETEAGTAVYERLERELEGLGTSALPGAFALLARRVPLAVDGAPPVPLDASGESALYAALQAWPQSEVEAWIAAHARDADALDDRLGALRVLGHIGAESTLGTIGAVLASIPPAEVRHPATQQAIEESLTALLARDAGVLTSLDAFVGRVDPGALPAMVRILAASNDWRATLKLEQFLGDDVALDIEILRTVGADRLRAHAALERTREWARLRFQVVNPELRRQATITSGQLLDAESVPLLLDALEKDDDARVRRSAHWALREITGLAWGPDVERWRSWFDRENAWFDEEAPALIEALQDDAQIAAAVRKLTAHELFRDALAAPLTELIGHEDALIAKAAIGAHVGLASSHSIGPLVDALDRESRIGIRSTLADALERLTGESLGPDPAAWRDWFDAQY